MKDITDKQVCKAYVEAKRIREGGVLLWPYELLQEWTGESQKICYACCERAENRGYIDSGVTTRSGWVTDRGLELIGGSDD